MQTSHLCFLQYYHIHSAAFYITGSRMRYVLSAKGQVLRPVTWKQQLEGEGNREVWRSGGGGSGEEGGDPFQRVT